jgi:hypothetical protein
MDKKINYKLTVLFIFIISCIFNIGCGKTEFDEEWSATIIGKWEPYDLEGEKINTLPIYDFREEDKGDTYMPGQPEIKDSFSWEIIRGQLKIYYKKAPSGYFVAYDQYHSRSLFKIHSFEQDKIKLTMFLYNGYQREFYLHRYEEPEVDEF